MFEELFVLGNSKKNSEQEHVDNIVDCLLLVSCDFVAIPNEGGIGGLSEAERGARSKLLNMQGHWARRMRQSAKKIIPRLSFELLVSEWI